MNLKLKVVCLSLWAVFGVSGGVWAQSADSGSGQGSDAAKAPVKDVSKDATKLETQEVPALPVGSSVLGGGLFGPISAPQAAVTPGYETPGFGLSGKQGAPVRVGDVLVYPKAVLSEGRNDNLLGTNSSIPAISSAYTAFVPEVNAQIQRRADRYGLVYRGNFVRYSSSSADNADNHSVEAYGENVFTGRERLAWGLGYQLATDPRGSSTGVNVHATPDRWHAPTARALFSYGAEGAVGKLELEANALEKTYENNLTDMAKLDVRTSNVAGRFFYRVMPKTSALFELRQVNNNYTQSGAQADNTTRYYQVGVTWDATAKTSGSIKLGGMQQSFSASSDPAVASKTSSSGSSWEANVRWAPQTYSIVDLGTSRTASNGTGVGDYLINTNYSAAWNHTWSSQWSSRLSASKLLTNYVNTVREDDTKNYGARLTYDFRRWLRLGLDYTRTQRSSTDPATDNSFTRNVTMFTAEGTL